MNRRWFYLSPHLDDAAFSCGGVIWEQAQAGWDVQVWTVCAGDPPEGPVSAFADSLQRRWGSGAESGQVRRLEDLQASKILGAQARHLPIPDCIYRRHPLTAEFLYASEESLFGELHPAELELVEHLADDLEVFIQPDVGDIPDVNSPSTSPEGQKEVSLDEISHNGISLVCPLGLGGHVDHQLTRSAAERIACSRPGCTLWYYADFPYVLEDQTLLSELTEIGWQSQIFPVTPAGLRAWQRSIAAHSSQISTFWDGEADMEAAIQAYCMETGGVRLWRKTD